MSVRKLKRKRKAKKRPFKQMTVGQRQELERAFNLQQAGALSQAEQIYKQVLAKVPDNVDVLHYLGILYSQTGNNEKSIGLLRKAVGIEPNNYNLHYNLGLLYHGQGELKKSVASLRAALKIEPDNAEGCYGLATVLMEMGELSEAIDNFQKCLMRKPDNILALNNLGIALRKAKRFKEAIKVYLKATDLDPNNYQYLHNLAVVYAEQGDVEMAIDYYKKAITVNNKSVEALNNLGVLYKGQGKRTEAIETFNKSLEADPNNHVASFNLAHLYESIHQLDKAERQCRDALKLSSDDPQCVQLLAVILRRLGRNREALACLQELPEQHDIITARSIHFEMGRLYDLEKNSEKAFLHWSKANALAQDDKKNKSIFLQRIEQFGTDKKNWHGTGEWGEHSSPIFLVGFPRSGTTLLDQILNCHPKLVVLEEKEILSKLYQTINQLSQGYPHALNDLDSKAILQLQSDYFKEAGQVIDQSICAESLLVDKFPLNMIYGGVIARVFPNSKIIFALRHPYDVCLSCFMQDFVDNEAMAHLDSLESTAMLYCKVMDLWHRLQGQYNLNCFYVKYESVVESFESTIKGVVDFLDLEWDPGLHEYAEKAKLREIITPSYHQVTQKIYTQAKYRWKRYQKQMEPVQKLLQPYLSLWGYDNE